MKRDDWYLVLFVAIFLIMILWYVNRQEAAWQDYHSDQCQRQTSEQERPATLEHAAVRIDCEEPP